jgi:signal transduction histidine kinase
MPDRAGDDRRGETHAGATTPRSPGTACALPLISEPDVLALTLADVPRLELDQLLGQLVDGAQEVMGTQGRLRVLLRANSLITSDLTLPAVLRHIVGAAREVVGARTAALGVIGPSGGLVEFVHEGMSAEAVAGIGHLPQGKGLLGALIDEPQPIRVRHLADDPRSSGFPPEHPPMGSFLGVPIRVRDEVYGNIYVTDSTRGPEFSAEDQELLTALAATAAIAIDNARLYAFAQTRGEWLQASAAITRQLLAPDSDDDLHLQMVAERTKDIADADLVVMAFPADTDPPQLRIEVTAGADADHLRGQLLPVNGSLAGQVCTTGEPKLQAQPTDGTGLAALTSSAVELGPVLCVPLAGWGRVHGVLIAARLAGRPGPTPDDVDVVASFVNHAALALELAEARREQEWTRVLDDRERIAADLHDHVIQRLFAAGLNLQGLTATAGPGRTTDRLQATIVELDDTIKQIRTSVFQLQQDRHILDTGVRGRLLDLLTELTPALGFAPALRLSGPMEGTLSEAIAEDLFAVLREALTNIARHAGARSADVDVTAAGGPLTLRVGDDGRGMGLTQRRSGLANMRRRAEAHHGTFDVTPRTPSGTEVFWSVLQRS